MLNILYEIESANLSDENHKKLFTSSEYYDFLDKKILEVCKDWNQYRSELRLKYEKTDETACTDNLEIMLNAGCLYFLSDTLKKCFLIQNGVIFHELGHRLFTMFGGMETYISTMAGGYLYPVRPKLDFEYEENVQKLEDYIKDEHQAKLLASLMFSLTNDIEDGRIENILLSYLVKYTNMHIGLNLLRQKTFEESPSYEEIRESVEKGEMKFFPALEQLILYYGRFGEIKGYDHSRHSEDALIKKFDLIQNDLDRCLDATEELEYFMALNNIVAFLIDDIIEYIDAEKSEAEEQLQNQSGTGTPPGASGGTQSGSSGNTQSGGSPSSPSGGQGSSSSASGSGLTKEIVNQILEAMGNDHSKLAATTAVPQGKNNQSGAQQVTGQLNSLKNQLQNDDDDAQRPPYTRTNSISSTFGDGSIETIDDFVESSSVDNDLKWLAKVITDQESDDALEKQIVQDLRDFNQKIDFPSIHKGVDACFIRHKVTEANRKAYKQIGSKAEKLASDMAKKSDNFQDTEMDLPVLRYSGKRFCASEVYKGNLKYFENNLIPEESPKLVVALVIDESGSMGGQKIQYARQLALTTYLYCRKIEAKVLIIGHSTSSTDTNVNVSGQGDVAIFCYSDFEKDDENDKYRIMNIQARGCNRDGYALRYAKEKLAQESGDRKLLMIVSDGSPNDDNYHGTVAAKDLQEIVRECEKEDIGILAAAIDSDKDTIRGIYGKEHFLDITDLEKLPTLLTQKIKMLYQ